MANANANRNIQTQKIKKKTELVIKPQQLICQYSPDIDNYVSPTNIYIFDLSNFTNIRYILNCLNNEEMVCISPEKSVSTREFYIESDTEYILIPKNSPNGNYNTISNYISESFITHDPISPYIFYASNNTQEEWLENILHLYRNIFIRRVNRKMDVIPKQKLEIIIKMLIDFFLLQKKKKALNKISKKFKKDFFNIIYNIYRNNKNDISNYVYDHLKFEPSFTKLNYNNKKDWTIDNFNIILHIKYNMLHKYNNTDKSKSKLPVEIIDLIMTYLEKKDSYVYKKKIEKENLKKI